MIVFFAVEIDVDAEGGLTSRRQLEELLLVEIEDARPRRVVGATGDEHTVTGWKVTAADAVRPDTIEVAAGPAAREVSALRRVLNAAQQFVWDSDWITDDAHLDALAAAIREAESLSPPRPD